MYPPCMYKQCGRNLNPICSHHPKDSMEGIGYMPMCPQLLMIDPGMVLLSQFVLHIHEQFRQLDELTPLDEQLPHSVRLTLLQTAVRSAPELRIVGTMEEYMSLI